MCKTVRTSCSCGEANEAICRAFDVFMKQMYRHLMYEHIKFYQTIKRENTLPFGRAFHMVSSGSGLQSGSDKL